MEQPPVPAFFLLAAAAAQLLAPLLALLAVVVSLTRLRNRNSNSNGNSNRRSSSSSFSSSSLTYYYPHASSSSSSSSSTSLILLLLLLALICLAHAFQNTVLALPSRRTTTPSLLALLFTAITTPLLIPAAYELCHALHGGPKRRLLYHDQVGRLAAAAAALALMAYALVDLFAPEKSNGSPAAAAGNRIPMMLITLHLPATRAASAAGSTVLALAGACLWRRTGTAWPYLTVMQIAILVGRVVTVYPPKEPYYYAHHSSILAQSLWDLLLTISLALAIVHVACNSLDEHAIAAATVGGGGASPILDAHHHYHHHVHQPLLRPHNSNSNSSATTGGGSNNHVHWNNYGSCRCNAAALPPAAAGSIDGGGNYNHHHRADQSADHTYHYYCDDGGDGCNDDVDYDQHADAPSHGGDVSSFDALVASRRELAKWTRATATSANSRTTTPPTPLVRRKDYDADDGDYDVGNGVDVKRVAVERGDSDRTITEE
ncbi:hypothetical protein HDU86_001932 [Geranomyces michiganensis]|nr:hypothetical protein HDU86_001932 [Geranomyces michiganensis]